jgi:homoserine dehydrogenase
MTWSSSTAPLALGAAAIGAAFLVAYRRRPGQPQTLYLTLIGFGAVHKALARLIFKDRERLLREHNLEVVYRAVIARHGAWEAAPGSEMSSELVAELANGRTRLCDPGPAGVSHCAAPSVQTILEILSRTASGPGLRCICEAIDVDYVAAEPAASYLRQALRLGSHAVSANKGPVVHCHEELTDLAAARSVRYLHESAVMDGVPIFSCWRAGFAPGGARLLSFRGCLNSTSGVVLAGMHAGQTMAQALRTAQDAGIAEADPSGDLSGMDAAVKVVALTRALALDRNCQPLRLADVRVSGIEHVTPDYVRDVASRGRKLRLVAGAEVANDARVAAYVRLEELAPSDPLSGLDGADAAVTFTTDRLAPVTIVQTGSVVEDTAFGTWADILRACRPAPP